MRSFVLSCTLLFGMHINVNAQSERVVLIEQFSNAGCPICGTYTPPITNYVSANPTKVVAVVYHAMFPHFDSLYYENPADVNNRVAYYDVQGVPYSVVDGNAFTGSSASLSTKIDAEVSNRAVVPEQYKISNIGTVVYQNGKLSGTFTVKSLVDNAAANIKLQVAVIENTVFKTDYTTSPGANSEPEYRYAMRKLLPDANGIALKSTNTGQSDTTSINWPISKVKRLDEIRVVVFVQNNDTKEILQAAMFSPQNGVATGISNINAGAAALKIFPNPAKDNVTVQFEAANLPTTLTIADITGRIVLSEPIAPVVSEKRIDTSGLSKGLYIVRVSGALNAYNKLIIE